MKTKYILFQIEHIKNIALSDYDDRYLYERMISEEVEELNELVKESDSLPCVRDRFNDFISKQKDISEEIQKVINNEFWDLI